MKKLSLVCILVGMSLAAPAFGYLKIHPENPHYFQETKTGKAVLIASCGGTVPTSKVVNNNLLIKNMKKNNITYGRVWHLLPWGGTEGIWPWARSVTPGAYMGGDGGNKYDLNKWNPIYWTRMKDSLAKCNSAGIYEEIHLFDRCGMSPASPKRWGNNPWASDNNINNIEVPDSKGDGTPDFYLYAEKPNLRYQQERYVKKMIDETVKYDIVIYEIENEHWQYDNPDFAEHYAKFVKDYIAEKYPNCPRLVSYSSLQDDLEAFYTIPYVDIVNRHFGKAAENNPSSINDYIEPRWNKNKAINIDEFANGTKDPAILRQMCWIIVTSGGNFHIEGPYDSAKPVEIVENIRLFKELSGWDFIHSAPNKGLVTSGGGYCMAQPGKEYVAYFPKGGRKKVNLAPSEEYVARWWNPAKGGFGIPMMFSHSGGDRVFNTPNSDDWVLFITTRSVEIK